MEGFEELNVTDTPRYQRLDPDPFDSSRTLDPLDWLYHHSLDFSARHRSDPEDLVIGMPHPQT
jgi:hypothetical protein